MVLLGGGGHASDVLSCVEAADELEVLGFLDDDPNAAGSRLLTERGVAHLGPIADLGELDPDVEYLLAVGYPTTRRRLLERLGQLERRAATLVHPSSDVDRLAEIGLGAVVLGGARISAGARLGAHAQVSYLAAVGHGSTLGACAMVMPGAMVSGDVVVGDDVLIGTNATVLEGVVVGAGARVGAGAVVVGDVAPASTVVGSPARPIRA